MHRLRLPDIMPVSAETVKYQCFNAGSETCSARVLRNGTGHCLHGACPMLQADFKYLCCVVRQDAEAPSTLASAFVSAGLPTMWTHQSPRAAPGVPSPQSEGRQPLTSYVVMIF